MLKSYVKLFSLMLMGILVNFSLTGCGSSDNDSAQLVAVEVSPAKTYVQAGEGVQYIATAIYSDNRTQNVTGGATWRSSNVGVASINENGIAVGVSTGAVLVAATYVDDGVEKTGFARLDVLKDDPVDKPVQPPVEPTPPVEPPPVEPVPPATFVSLTIDGNDIVSIGLTEQLNAVVTLSDNTTYTANDKVNWTSSDPALASVNTAGIVTGTAEGSVTITATAKTDNSVVATHTMTVTAAVLDKIQIEYPYTVADPGTPVSEIGLAVGEEKYITAWGIYSDGSRQYINTSVFWSTGDGTIASMDLAQSSSDITGVSGGTTTATARWQGKEASITVNVSGPAMTGIEIHIGSSENGTVISESNPLEIAVGEEKYITAWAKFDDGSLDYINTQVFWSSANNDIASMDLLQRNSNVTGVSSGSTTVSARFYGETGTATVNVSAAP